MKLSIEDYAELKEISTQAEGGRLKEALAYAQRRLEKDPDDIEGLCLGSYAWRRMGNAVAAYLYATAAIRQDPNNAALWLNVGGAAHLLWLPDVAQNAYEQAIKFARDPAHRAAVWLNLSALHIDAGDFDEGERCARECLKLAPKSKKSATANIGYAQLARREWREGWKNYREIVGVDFCPKIVYKDEPEWDGSPDKVVVVYEVEGIGDAISFASMLPDAIAVSKKIIIDCDPRLANLFQRSFPRANVYGTRRENGSSGRTWAKKDHAFDASTAISQLGQFFRNEDTDFPGTAYLEACPTRTAMWSQRFTQMRKPVIGVAWTGGVAKNNARNRALTLEQLLPVFRSVDAHWVSLQYRDAAREIEAFKAKHPSVDLVQYPWATLTGDYDDTAALIAALDQVVCMQTAVGHTAGALGVPVTVLLPRATTWRYGKSSDSIPWYSSMRIVRQATHGAWESEIGHVATLLGAHFGNLPSGAGAAALEGRLRSHGRAARINGQLDH